MSADNASGADNAHSDCNCNYFSANVVIDALVVLANCGVVEKVKNKALIFGVIIVVLKSFSLSMRNRSREFIIIVLRLFSLLMRNASSEWSVLAVLMFLAFLATNTDDIADDNANANANADALVVLAFLATLDDLAATNANADANANVLAIVVF